MSGTGRESDEAPGAAGTLSALVAEDSLVSEVVVVKLLEQRHFRVDVASDGRQAVLMHEAGDYDVIFMDCQLPQLDGYAATAEIREHEGQGRHTPIIALTASTLAGTRDRCLEAGMDDYLAKPVRAGELDAAIGRALAHGEA